MVPKMTISIPDDLHQRMQGWKKTLNISKVCQKAISEEILKKELFQGRVAEEKTMDEISAAGDWDTIEGQYQVGKELGFEYAKRAPYHEIKAYEIYAEKWDEKDEELLEEFHYDLDVMSILVKLFGELEPTDLMKVSKDSIPLTDHFDFGFMEGIVEYIREEFSSMEVSRLVFERDKKIRLAKDEDEKMRIFVDYGEKAEEMIDRESKKE